MDNILILSVNIVVVFCLSTLLIIYKKKNNNIEKEEIIKFINMNMIEMDKEIIILFLNYDDKNFERIASLLNENSNISLFIILNGPHWLVKMRQKIWTRHKVFSMNDYSWIRPKIRSQVTVYKHEKLLSIFDLYTFLDLNLRDNSSPT